LSGLNRLHQRILIRPTKIVNSVRNSIAVNAKASAPVRNGVSLSVNRDLSDSGLVVVLLNPSRPLAVARLVMAFAVDSLQSVLGRRSLSHVGNKVREGVEPAVANVDSTASVAWMGAKTASFAHGAPNAVFGCIAGSVRAKASAGLIALKASAAFGIAVIELVGGYVARLATLASANPLANMAAWIRRSFDGRQTTKLHSSQINFGWHTQTV
jgi:hypothetical protein